MKIFIAVLSVFVSSTTFADVATGYSCVFAKEAKADWNVVATHFEVVSNAKGQLAYQTIAADGRAYGFCANWTYDQVGDFVGSISTAKGREITWSKDGYCKSHGPWLTRSQLFVRVPKGKYSQFARTLRPKGDSGELYMNILGVMAQTPVSEEEARAICTEQLEKELSKAPASHWPRR